jgi:FtsP/CotA-like multicopper oxidase with cupredoxin domain
MKKQVLRKLLFDPMLLQIVRNMNAKSFLVISLAVFLLPIATTQIYSVKATTVRSFTLYGAREVGWGFTASNITSPGPTIVVEQGDTVNMTLTSHDGSPHQFWVIYTNGSSTPQSGDPLSLQFSGTVNYSFAATNTIGTYEYRCSIHGHPMYGYMKVVPTGTIPEFQPLIMLSLLVAGTIVAALAYKRKKKV